MVERAKVAALLACALFAIASQVAAQLRLTNVNPRPEVFSDSVLDVKERGGQGRAFIDGLGFVRQLSAKLAPSQAKYMRTRFDIFNKRAGETRNILYEHDIWCSPDGSGTLTGPYQYQLYELARSGFSIGTKTIIIIPGYRSLEEDDWIVEARGYWLELEPESDIIQVSWTDSNHGLYERVAANTVIIARQLTVLLHYLATLSNSSLADNNFVANIHIIGHSLGAHIAGFVGQDLAGRLGRITGLDPAGPSFDQFEPSQRLDPEDAKLVAVIHTNRGRINYFNTAIVAPLAALSSLPGFSRLGKVFGRSYNGEADTSWFGIDKNIGHLDYNANNGKVQPGCEGLFHICDHNRAQEIYTRILKHEVDTRRGIEKIYKELQHLDRRALIKSNRLFGYRSLTFETFLTGKFAQQSCPELVGLADTSQISRWDYERAFNVCSVPLDLVSSADELIDELNARFPNEAANGSPLQAATIYFQTLDQSAHVGDHWLLSIELNQNGTTWKDGNCALKVKFKSLNDGDLIKSKLEISKLESHIRRKGTIDIPLAYAANPTNRLRLKELVACKQRGADQEFQYLARHVIPQRISLKIERPKTASFISAVKNATLKMVKLDSLGTKCELQITQIQVQLIGEPTFWAIYKNEQNSRSNSLENLLILNATDYKESRSEFKYSTAATLSLGSSMLAYNYGMVTNFI